MNERDIPQTQKETAKTSPFDTVKIEDYPIEGRLRRVNLPDGLGMGLVTGQGEIVNADGTTTSVGEVMYTKDGEARVARGPMEAILATDARLRAERANERERQLPIASKLGGAALDAVAQPRSVSDPEQHPEDWALPYSEIRALIEGKQEEAQPLITGIPEHLRPTGYVQPEEEDNSNRDRRRVPVAMPANPHGALGFPNREDYFKSLGQKPDSHN